MTCMRCRSTLTGSAVVNRAGAHDACAAGCMALVTVCMLCRQVMPLKYLPRPWAGWQWPSEALQKIAYMVIQDPQILQDSSLVHCFHVHLGSQPACLHMHVVQRVPAAPTSTMSA